MKCPPHCRGPRQEAHCHEEAKEIRQYYNYKGFFFLVLLALVDAKDRFLWIDCGSSGSCSDEQILNRSNLREKIEVGRLGLPAPEPLGD